MPKLINSTSSNSDNEVSSSVKNPHYYTLSHFESVNFFYVHTSDSIKELQVIESEIESEFENSTRNFVKSPTVNEVYGFYCGTKDQYFRARVISQVEKKDKEDVSCEVFFMDYGNKERVDVKCLFFLSDEIKQYAPQARCCKLNGFQNEINKNDEIEGLIYF